MRLLRIVRSPMRRAAATALFVPLAVHAAAAAPNPCRVACRTTRTTCFQGASAAFTAAKQACAAAATPADKRACRRSAKTTRAAARATCRTDFATCAAACPKNGATTTTLPGQSCGDAEASDLAGISAAHNVVRAGATPAPDPPLPPICYNATIAASAQTYADGCVYEHDLQRLRSLGYGENLYAAAGSIADTAARDAVPAWACEATNDDYASNTCSLDGCPKAAGVCGPYTQLVWRGTQKVGCGIAHCTTGSPFAQFPSWTFVVCDYQPPGNVQTCDTQGCVAQKPY